MSTPQHVVVTAGALPPTFPSDSFEQQVRFVVAHSEDEVRSLVTDADVLHSWYVPESVPADAPRLRWIHVPSAGVDQLRSLPVWTSDVVITASMGIHAVPMAEHFFAMLLALTRQIHRIVQAQERQAWLHDRRSRNQLTELRGKTIGIIGWGKIGNAVAHLAGAFGMRVIGTRWSIVVPRETWTANAEPYVDPPLLEPPDLPPDIVYPAVQVHDVLAESDVVVLVLPLTRETEKSFSTTEFSAMKRGALFFNIGRGAVVDDDALLQALRSGRLAGAGLDVVTKEPLPQEHPLWRMPNVIISPHVGGVSDQTRDRGARLFAINLARYLQKETLLNLVDRSHGY